jgi:hypothetical protein
MKVGLQDLNVVCVSLNNLSHINFWMLEPIYMKLGTYITATDRHLNGVLHKSLPYVCVAVCVALLSLLGKGPVKCIPL